MPLLFLCKRQHITAQKTFPKKLSRVQTIQLKPWLGGKCIHSVWEWILEVRTGSKHIGISSEGSQWWTKNARKGIMRELAFLSQVPQGWGCLLLVWYSRKVCSRHLSPTRIQNGVFHSLSFLPSLSLPSRGLLSSYDSPHSFFSSHHVPDLIKTLLVSASS